MRKLICIWALSFLGWWPSLGQAQGLLLQSAWLEDASGQMTLAQAQADPQRFQPYTGVLARGYTASAYWIRLTVAPSPDQALVLRIRPSYIDQVELFDAASGGAGRTLTGDRHRPDLDGYHSLSHGFMIPGRPQARDVYLRLQSTSTMLVHVEALTRMQATRADHRQELLYSLYLGLLAAFTIWALLQWLTRRETLIAVFLGKQVIVLAHAAAILGYLPLVFSDLLRPDWADRITSALVLAYVASGVGFMYLLLREFKPARWLMGVLAATLLAYVPVTVLFLAGDVRRALELNMIIAAVSSIVVLLVALSARAWDGPPDGRPPALPRWVLVSFNVALVLAAFSSALPSLAGVKGAEWNLNAPVFGGFITSLLMTVLLSLRSRNLEKQSQAALLHLEVAEHAADSERARREEQERFLAMLTHELKTPLGVARISLGALKLSGPARDRIDRALGNINAIVDRCRITDQLEHRQLLPDVAPCDLGVVVDECIAGCSEPERVKVLESKAFPLESDSQLLSVCLSNLIDNALKYSPPQATVTVRVRRLADGDEAGGVAGVAVTIANAIGAAGVPDRGELFSKYYRSPGARSKSGSGLGLYLSRQIAHLLGARLSHRVVQDEVEFSLWVPA